MVVIEYMISVMHTKHNVLCSSDVAVEFRVSVSTDLKL
jgi:hypothetical protein